MSYSLSKEGKLVIPYQEALDLINFYEQCPELSRAGEILIDKSMAAEFQFQWGIIDKQEPSYGDTIGASIKALKGRVKNISKRKENSSSESISLKAILQNREEEKKKTDGDSQTKNQGRRRGVLESQREAMSELKKLDKYTIYNNLMQNLVPPQGVASRREDALAQYNDPAKEKSLLLPSEKKKGKKESTGKGEEDSKERQTEKGFLMSIASIASGEMPEKIPSKSSIVSSEECPADIKWMEQFMRECLKYKLIFGMVPYNYGLDENGRKRLFTRDISEGEFVIFLDQNSQIQGYWQDREDIKTRKTSGKSFLYIWNEHKPRMHMKESPFNSVTSKLRADWLTLESMLQNKKDAEWRIAHVPLATKCVEQLAGINEMSNNEVFSRLLGRSSNNGLTNNESQKKAMDRDHMSRTLLIAGVMNNHSNREFMLRNVQRELTSTGKIKSVSRGGSWDNHRLPLAFGRDTVSLTLPQPPKDYESMRKLFQELVYTTLGVPLKEASGEARAKTVKGEEGIQTMYNESAEKMRKSAALCLEECFTIAFGEEEDERIRRGYGNVLGGIDQEMKQIEYLETIYGLGLDNPSKAEQIVRNYEAFAIENFIHGKAFEVVQHAMTDGVTLDPILVRQYIKDRITIHKQNISELEKRGSGLWNAYKSQIRLHIQWKPVFTKELMSMLIEGYNLGLIGKEPTSLFFFDALGYPLDTPTGEEQDERRENDKTKSAIEMEKIQHQNQIEILKLQHKHQLELEKLKAKNAKENQAAKTESGVNLPQGNILPTKKSSVVSKKKEGEKKGKKRKTEEIKSPTETSPVIEKKAKKAGKTERKEK